MHLGDHLASVDLVRNRSSVGRDGVYHVFKRRADEGIVPYNASAE
jgi:hypothetical protein